MSRPPGGVFTAPAFGSGLTEPRSACQRILLQRGSSAATGTDRGSRAAPLRGGISLEKVLFRAEISPLALRAIIVLLGCDCVPVPLKAMTFHGVRGGGKKGGFGGENRVAGA